MVAGPQPRNGEAEGDHGTRKTEEKGRGVNRHPVILETRIEAITLQQGDVISLLKDRCIDGLAQQQHRAGAQFYHPITYTKVYAQDHRNNYYLHSAERRHYGALPPPGRYHQHVTEDDVPEHPEQERTFLAFPKRTENIPLL